MTADEAESPLNDAVRWAGHDRWRGLLPEHAAAMPSHPAYPKQARMIPVEACHRVRRSEGSLGFRAQGTTAGGLLPQ